MDKKDKEKTIKALLYWLRHHPGHIGLELKEGGWADISTITGNRKHKITSAEIQYIVENDEKNRFTLNKDASMIKSNEGHTVTINS